MVRIILRYSFLCVFLNIIYTRSQQWLKLDQVQVLVYLPAFIIPIVLYLAYREMLKKHWNYSLPIGSVVVVGLFITCLSATMLTLVNYSWRYYTADELTRLEFNGEKLGNYLFAYIKWYLLFALISIPIVYGILRWQLRKKP